MGTLKNKILWIGVALLVLVALVASILVPNVQKLMMSEEDRLAMTYHQFTDEEKKVDGCENVEFLAYFTRDLNKDGIAEKLAGTTKNLSEKDTLYLELNVVTDGYLENGKITFSDGNNYFVSLSNLLKDDFFAENYIAVSDAKEINLKTINAGTQRLVLADVSSKIDRNINNFSKASTVSLTGTWVSSDGQTSIPVNKVIELQTDWYGTVNTSCTAGENNIHRSIIQEDEEYQSEKYGIETLPEETAAPFTVSITTKDTVGKLPIKNTTTTIKVPQLWGFDPEWVNVEGGSYDSETRTITFSLNSVVSNANEDGTLSTRISNQNAYKFVIKYPLDAYRYCFYSNGTYTEDALAEFLFDINASYTGYNNPNYENPYTSSISTKQKTVINLDRGGPKPIEIIERKVNFHQGLYANYQGRDGEYTFDGTKLLEAYDNPEQKYFYYVVDYTIKNNKSENVLVGLYNVTSDKIGGTDLSAVETNCMVYVDRWAFLDGCALGKNGNVDLYGMYYVNELDAGTNNIANAEYEHGGSLEYNKRGLTQLKRDDEYTKIFLDSYFENEEFVTDILDELNSSEWDYIITGDIAPTDIKIAPTDIAAHREVTFHVVKKLNMDGLRDLMTRDELLSAGNITTYEYNGDSNIAETIRIAYPKSYATIKWAENMNTTYGVDNSQVQTYNPDEPKTNKTLLINAVRGQAEDALWKDGAFVVELPSEFIDAEIKEVTITGANLKGYTLNRNKEGKNYYIKLLTENEQPVDNIYIRINLDLVTDARAKSKNGNVTLYYYNDNCDAYYNVTKDKYDVNNNANKNDNVGYATCNLRINASETMITVQTVSNYDDEGSETVAPNAAELSKQTRSADMNIFVVNNYQQAVSGAKILGRVPYQGNKYVLRDREIGSDFTAAMTGPITVPEDIQEATTVYYSELGEPGKDVNDPANGWKTADQIADWSKVKSYLIDFSSFVLYKGREYNFSYPVTIPEGLNYNDTSYATHAIEYDYNSPNGTIHLETEPTKVGLKIARIFNLTGLKFKEATDLRVKDAVYKLEEKNTIGDVVKSTTMFSNSNGEFEAQGLYVNAVYQAREISAPRNYMLSDKIVQFKVAENDDGTLRFEYISNDHFRAEEIRKDDDNKDLVYIEIDDEPKYQINVKYINDATDRPMNSVIVKLGDELKATDENGIVTYERLIPGTDYQLQEVQVKGNIRDNYDFNVSKDGLTYTTTVDSKMTIESFDYNETGDLMILNVVIRKQSNPTYTLEIVKVEKDSTKTDLSTMKKIEGAVFSLERVDDNEFEDELITDENGVATAYGLYQYVDGIAVTGKYILQEKVAPDGYIINGEEIGFVVSKENDELKVDFEDEDNLTSIKDVIISEGKVTIVIQDTAYFKLTKVDSADPTIKLANAKFVIYELNDDGSIKDCAKDIFGNYVGTQDEGAGEDSPYYVYTNEAGEISLPLRDGKYQIEEVEAPEGYAGEAIQTFEINNSEEVGQSTPYVVDPVEIPELVIPEVSEENTIEINYIEDLIDIGEQIANDNTYEGKKLVLQRNLDITDRASYRAPDDNTTYGDYDEDGETKTIFEEVNGPQGLKPLGRYNYTYTSGTYSMSYYRFDKPFKGIFDGNNHEINLVSTTKWKGYSANEANGLFACISDATFMNLGFTGDFCGQAILAYSYQGGFTLYNCYNKANINGSAAFVSTNINTSNDQNVHNIRVEKCYNEGEISQGSAGLCNYLGDSGANLEYVVFKDCSNKGNVTQSNSYSSTFGIVQCISAKVSKKVIFSNCTNEGLVSTGISGRLEINATNEVESGLEIVFDNCINKAEYFNKNAEAGIIGGGQMVLSNASEKTKVRILNCTNMASVQDDSNSLACGISKEIISNSSGKANLEIYNCVNKGKLTNETTTVSYGMNAGIIYSARQLKSVKIIDCKNEGDILGTNSTSNRAGIIASADDIEDIDIINCENTGNLQSANAQIIAYMKSTGTANIKDCKVAENVKMEKSGVGVGYFIGTAYVHNLNVENLHVDGGEIGTAYYQGGIAGWIYEEGSTGTTNFKNCTVNGSITTGSSRRGGIAGQINCNNVIIEDCSFTGEILVDCDNTGGLFGWLQATTGKVNKCYANATIHGRSNFVGGLIGYGGPHSGTPDYTIENCYFKGFITGDNLSGAGGIIGSNYYGSTSCSIKNCINYGNISTTKIGGNLGGIAGYDSGTTYENVYNYGNITVLPTTTLTSYSGSIGGIVGHGGLSIIKNSFNKGNIFTNGVTQVGGIVGYGNIIENCYNTGNIIALGKKYGYSSVGAGGICKYNENKIINCYNTGDIICDGDVGGIVAYNNNKEIENCYNTGNVISNDTDVTRKNVGALIVSGISGEEDIQDLANCYFASNITLGSTMVSKKGNEVDYDYMRTREFYNKLNVDGVWSQKEGQLPTFNFKMPIFGEATELNVTNEKVDYIIKTNAKDGGTISGESETPYETVTAGNDNIKSIVAQANEGFTLTGLTINGRNVELKTDEEEKISYEEGVLTLSAGYFKNMAENKFVTVNFTEDNVFKFTKVDEDDNTKKLKGAEFIVYDYDAEDLENRMGPFTDGSGSYHFVENDGKYVSNNQGVNNSVATGYLPIDLTEFASTDIFDFNFTVNTLSYSAGPKAYYKLTETTETPEFSPTDYSFDRVTSNQSYYIQLEGGKKYYIHFGYYKEDTEITGFDQLELYNFTLKPENSTEEILKFDDLSTVNVTSKKDKIYLKEIKAPEGYAIDSELHEYDINDGDSFLITNKKAVKAEVREHYYLLENGTKTTKKVASDDVIYGYVGEEYKTEVRSFDGLILSEENLPENAIGTFAIAPIDVNYYYEVADIDLTIHHYLDGTTTEIVPDETVSAKPQITIDIENETYTFAPLTYVLKNNANYIALINGNYNFVNVYSDAEEDLTINKTLHYDSNAELTYTYVEKIYDIKTQVNSHLETVVDAETGETSLVRVDGGTITGQDLPVYEQVLPGEDATKDIVITADEGYVINNVKIISTDDEGLETAKVLYGDGAQTCEITYAGDESEMTLTTFENVHAHKTVSVTFAPIVVPEDTMVIVHHTIEGKGEDYQTIVIEGKVGDEYRTEAIEIPGYRLKTTPTNANGTMTATTINVYYIYEPKDCKIIVRYIDINSEEEIDREEVDGKYDEEIDIRDYSKTLDGYTLRERPNVTTVKFTEEEQVYVYKYAKNMTVRAIYVDTEGNKISADVVISGYEGKAYETSAKDVNGYELVGIPDNASGTMSIGEDGKLEIIVRYEYNKIEEPVPDTKVVEKYVDINSKEVVESKDHEGKVGDEYRITPNVPNGYVLLERDKEGKDLLPKNAEGTMTEEVIEVVYYVAKEAKVKARYVVKYGGKDIADEEEIEGYEGKEYSVDPKDIDGYELIEIDGNPEGTMKPGENVVTFYYAKKATGIIPQTGINVFLYAMYAVTVIAITNGVVILVYKFRK